MDRVDSLQSADLRLFSSALEQIYTLVSLEEFPRQLFAVIESLIPEAILSAEDIDINAGTHTASLNFELQDPADYLATLAINLPRDNPAVAHNIANPDEPIRFFRLTDLISQRQFQQTGLYWDQFKPVGARYQLGIFPDVPGHIVGLSINRGKNFSQRESDLVRLLAPHIIRAHANAKLFTALQKNAARTPAFSPAALHRAGFTPRESEVLQWLVEGKRNSEIALILGAKTRTIGKHVENILAKLGVETRTAAAARAMEILHGG
jgi:DNA-binding CsgD family transcriptional regulator